MPSGFEEEKFNDQAIIFFNYGGVLIYLVLVYSACNLFVKLKCIHFECTKFPKLVNNHG